MNYYARAVFAWRQDATPKHSSQTSTQCFMNQKLGNCICHVEEAWFSKVHAVGSSALSSVDVFNVQAQQQCPSGTEFQVPYRKIAYLCCMQPFSINAGNVVQNTTVRWNHGKRKMSHLKHFLWVMALPTSSSAIKAVFQQCQSWNQACFVTSSSTSERQLKCTESQILSKSWYELMLENVEPQATKNFASPVVFLRKAPASQDIILSVDWSHRIANPWWRNMVPMSLAWHLRCAETWKEFTKHDMTSLGASLWYSAYARSYQVSPTRNNSRPTQFAFGSACHEVSCTREVSQLRFLKHDTMDSRLVIAALDSARLSSNVSTCFRHIKTHK